MTAVPCPHCERSCAGPAGLSAHIRSLHPEEARVVQLSERRGPSDDGIAWEDPPARGGRIAALVLAPLPALRANPGRWARLYTWTGKSSANGFRKGLAGRGDLADIEFSARALADGGSALYARCTSEGAVG